MRIAHIARNEVLVASGWHIAVICLSSVGMPNCADFNAIRYSNVYVLVRFCRFVYKLMGHDNLFDRYLEKAS